MDDGDEDAPPVKRQRMTRQTTTENKSGKNDETQKIKIKMIQTMVRTTAMIEKKLMMVIIQ